MTELDLEWVISLCTCYPLTIAIYIYNFLNTWYCCYPDLHLYLCNKYRRVTYFRGNLQNLENIYLRKCLLQLLAIILTTCILENLSMKNSAFDNNPQNFISSKISHPTVAIATYLSNQLFCMEMNVLLMW